MTWQDEVDPAERPADPRSRREDLAAGRTGRTGRTGRAEPVGRLIRILELRINPDRALPIMLGTVVLLSCVSFSGRLLQHGLNVNFTGLNTWITAFDLQGSGNVPAWFRSVVLLVDALALWTVADDAWARGDGWSRHWRLLSIAFAVLCLDELAGLHQQVLFLIQKSLHVSDLFFFAWVLPAIAVLAALGVMYGRFLWASPRGVGLGLGGAAALYLCGAVCLWLPFGAGPDSVLHATRTTVGVALQMFATVAVAATVGRYDRTGPPARPGQDVLSSQVTDIIEMTLPHELDPVGPDDVTAVWPVTALPDADRADDRYVRPGNVFERPQHAAHQSW